MKPADKEFKSNMGSFFLKGLLFLGLIALMRLTEYLIGPQSSLGFKWNSIGLWQDVISAGTWLIFISPIYIFTVRYFKKLADLILALWLSVGLVFQLLLVIYFSVSSTALRAEHLYGMSGSQVDDLLTLYGFSWYYFILIVPVFYAMHLILALSKKMQEKKLIEFIAASLIVCGSFINIFWPIQEGDFDSDLEYDIKANKAQLFIKSYFNFDVTSVELTDGELSETLERYYEIQEIEKEEYFEYPFFNPEKSVNHLGGYFVKSDTAPNVVVIIAESLGKVFSGPNARLGSFTPCLDSLQNHSLYFENCLANAERTFGALPNIIAGIPEGDQGFLNLRSSYPDHLSLPMLLKENGNYQTNFFCGARAEYDFMDEYLMFQKFDKIYGERSFKRNEVMGEVEFKEGDKRDFNWGAEDLHVFKESMEMMYSDTQSFFNLYLTTSFHEPYAYQNQESFLSTAKTAIEKSDNEVKDDLLDEVGTIAALMYMDYSIAQCIENYKKRSDFENTIFIIVGDHGTKFLSDNSRIEKYHVPLMIYSPLLKEPQKFSNVLCQKDIPSALQALLRDNFNLNLPDFSISQSNNLLDESHSSFALMYADKRLENFYHEGRFIVGEKIYELNEKMELLKSSIEENEKDELRELLKSYKALSKISCYENRLVPNEVLKQWTELSYLFFIDDGMDQPYTGNHASAVYQNSMNQKEAFSDSTSASNGTEAYLPIIREELFSSNERVRLKMTFKIKSSDGDLPVLYVTETKEGENDIIAPIHLSNDKGFLRTTTKDDWQEFEFSHWLANGTKNNELRSVSIHLHKLNKAQFYIDDLQIELREF